jgi:hypothetical protein
VTTKKNLNTSFTTNNYPKITIKGDKGRTNKMNKTLKEIVKGVAAFTLVGAITVPYIICDIQKENKQKHELTTLGYKHLSKNKIESANGITATLKGDEIVLSCPPFETGADFPYPRESKHIRIKPNDPDYTFFRSRIEGDIPLPQVDSNLVERVQDTT